MNHEDTTSTRPSQLAARGEEHLMRRLMESPEMEPGFLWIKTSSFLLFSLVHRTLHRFSSFDVITVGKSKDASACWSLVDFLKFEMKNMNGRRANHCLRITYYT